MFDDEVLSEVWKEGGGVTLTPISPIVFVGFEIFFHFSKPDQSNSVKNGVMIDSMVRIAPIQ